MTLLNLVKMALRITSDAYDAQLNMLIAAAEKDLKLATGISEETDDELIQQAICTYCMLNFGIVDDAERLKKSYDEQKAQLSMATGYTDWLGGKEV